MDEMIIIVNSGKCDWGHCVFCGWGRLDYPKKTIVEMKNFLDKKLEKVKDLTWLKIFNSGSFFDEKQIPKGIRSYLVKQCEKKNIKNLVVESIPKFITKDNLKDVESVGVKVHVAIGLEVADDKILKKIGKGFLSVEKYKDAVKNIHDNNSYVRTYVLANPPFVKNVEESLFNTLDLAEKYSDSIAVCNTYPHMKAPLFELWIRKRWKPLDRNDFEKLKKRLHRKGVEWFFDNFVFIPSFPKEKQEWIRGATIKELKHPYFEVWQDYICRFYEKPKGMDHVLFVPCAFRKPYTKSRLHRAIKTGLRNIKTREKIHLVVISSPGVIPIDLCNRYPFNRYDWPEWEETKNVKKEYVNVTIKRVENYLKRHKYKKYYSYLKLNSESFKALEKACSKLGIKLVNCIDKNEYEKIRHEKNPLALPEMTGGLRKIS